MYVFGNGESRQGFDVSRCYGPKVGCNGIMRDYKMDHLVCVDRRMVEESIESGVNQHTIVYTRYDWFPRYKKHTNIRQLPDLPYKGDERWDEPFQWGSGPYAVLLGAKLSKEVKLIGFDLHSKTKTVNNVYKDTSGYDASTKNAVDPRYWIHQIGQVFKWYPKRKFTIYQLDNWQIPQNWKLANVSVDYIDNL